MAERYVYTNCPGPDLELQRACSQIAARLVAYCPPDHAARMRYDEVARRTVALAHVDDIRLVPRPTLDDPIRLLVAWQNARAEFGPVETSRDRRALIAALERALDGWDPGLAYALRGLFMLLNVARGMEWEES